MAGRRHDAQPGNEERHQRQGGHFHHVRQAGRQTHPEEAGNLPPVGLLQPGPDLVRPVDGIAAQQQHGHQQQKVVDQQRCPGAADSALRRQARTAGNKPDGQRNLHRQCANLQPGDQHRFAQRLIERAEQPEQQRGHKGQRQHGQISPHLALHGFGNLGPLQQAPRKQQHCHSRNAQQRAQIKALTHGLAHRMKLTRTAHLGPDGQQGLDHADQADINADVNGRAHRQGGQRRVTVAAGDHGVGHTKGDHRQLAHQHGAGMPQDESGFFHAPGITGT